EDTRPLPASAGLSAGAGRTARACVGGAGVAGDRRGGAYAGKRVGRELAHRLIIVAVRPAQEPGQAATAPREVREHVVHATRRSRDLTPLASSRSAPHRAAYDARGTCRRSPAGARAARP